MCGIYGVLHKDGPVESGPLADMDQALIHRGPDDSGVLLDGPCGMGMRRLSIIDLAGGRQPIASEDRAVWVVMNGEIYNHRALRQELCGRGHEYKSSSDTEALVHLYEELGERMVERLRGMYAFAVWDRRRGALTLGRDPLGIKPLYYAETDIGFVYASELRGLLAHPSVERALDPAALSHFLSFGTTPSDASIIHGAKKLPPGHTLLVEAGRVVRSTRYWDLRPKTHNFAGGVASDAPFPSGISFSSAAERLRGLLEDAVRSHLESDVPVGAFLSGGVDSATVVALMSRLGGRPRTFSIGWDEPDFDELDYARLVARRYDTEHEELVVRPDAFHLIDELLPFLDEPFADVSALPTFLVSKLAARSVKVVLSGDGGDEVFGGYDHYVQGLADARRFDGLPHALRRGLGALSSLLPEAAPGRRYLRHASLGPRLRFLDESALFPADMKAQLLASDVGAHLLAAADPVEARAQILDGAPGDALSRLLYLDTMTYLPLDILTKVDRMSMAHSLEVRPPLLDLPLVEAVSRLPSEWKVKGAAQKILFKEAVKGWVPDEILHRRKRGFGVPIRRWFRGPLKHEALAPLVDRKTEERGLFDPAFVRALVRQHLGGRRDHSLRLYALLILELWTRAVIEERPRRSRALEVQRA